MKECSFAGLEAPTKPPGHAGRDIVDVWAERLRSRMPYLDVRPQPKIGRFGPESRAVQHVQEKSGVISSSRLERRGRVPFPGLPWDDRPAKIVVRGCPILVEAPVPDKTGSGHPERPQDEEFNEIVELLPRQSLSRLLEVKEAFARVVEPFAGGEVCLERQVVIAPVRQTCAVAEDVLGGDRSCPLVGRHVSGQVVGE